MNSKKSSTNFYNHPVFFQILLVAILVSLVYLFKFSFNITHNKPLVGSAVLVINLENKTRTFTGDVMVGTTLLDVLNLSALAGKITLKYSLNTNNETDIMKIDDHINGTPGLFVFYLNSRKLDTRLLNKTRIKAGDKIEINLH